MRETARLDSSRGCKILMEMKMTRDEFKKLSTIKPKNDPNAWMDEPVKSDKWSNLYFMTDGRTILSKVVYSSEEKAAEVTKYFAHGSHCLWNDKPLSPAGYLSHVIQIPVKS